MATFEREVKTSKTEAYEIDVSSWLSNESITGLTVAESTGNATVVSSEIDGPLLQVLVLGVTNGNANLTFEYSTATRSNCYTATVKVIADCS
jgi:hypothetical protein